MHGETAKERADHLKWRAEQLVQDALMKTTGAKKAVKATIKTLKAQEKEVAGIIKGVNKR